MYPKLPKRTALYRSNFKVVNEIANGELTAIQAVKHYRFQARSTVTNWMRKYNNFDWHNITPRSCSEHPNNLILELENENPLLKKQKKTLEKQASRKANFSKRNTTRSKVYLSIVQTWSGFRTSSFWIFNRHISSGILYPFTFDLILSREWPLNKKETAILGGLFLLYSSPT